MVREGLLSKALGRLMSRAAVAVGPHVVESLQTLFPPGVLPNAVGGVALSPELRSKLESVAQTSVCKYPARSGPGPNGSRFEHWGTARADQDALEEVGFLMVRFLMNEVPEDFLSANLGARLIALRKPNGKIRPIACGSVLRRIAAKTACTVFRNEIKAACGPHQYAVGKQAGCEHVHKTVTALSSADPSLVFLAFDASNAFNTIPRQAVLNAIGHRLPELSTVVNAWLGQATTHM